MNKKKLISWIVFAVLLILLLLTIFGRKKIEIAQPKIGPVTDAIYSLGTIKSDNTYSLRTAITSRIITLFVSEGDVVQKNAPLIYLESGQVLTAPFAGVISNINMRQGEITIPSQTLLSLINFEKMYIVASLDQESILKVRKGQKVEISFESMRSKKAKGVVTSVYPANSSFMAKIVTKEMPAGVLPEMTCDLAIEISKNDKALMIPSNALDGKKNAMVLRNKERLMIKPQLANTSGDYIEVLGNEILPSDKLIIALPKNPFVSLIQLLFILAMIILLVKILRKQKEEEK